MRATGRTRVTNPKNLRNDTIEKKVLAALVRRPMTVGEVSRITGHPSHSCGGRLTKLVQDGAIEVIGTVSKRNFCGRGARIYGIKK